MSVLTAGYWLLYRNAVGELESAVRVQQRGAVQESLTVVRNRLSIAGRDICFMADNPVLDRFLDAGGPGDLALLGDFFHDLMVARRGLFDQMRYLDERGMEVVRVDNVAAGTRLVPAAELQDKADRYYFRRSLALPAGEIYLSPFDLNVEHGQVERPFKPTLRFGTRARDAAGHERGVLVVNFLGSELLERLRGIGAARGMEFWLTNQDGAWLVGPDPDLEWGFMFPRRPLATIAALYPDAWQAARASDGSRVLERREQGAILTLARFTPAHDMLQTGLALHTDPGVHWYLVIRLAPERLVELRRGLVERYLWSYSLLALLFAASSALVGVLAGRRRQALLAVEQRERQFHALLESAPDAILVCDVAGRIVMVNAQAERAFGVSRADLIGQAVERLIPERFREGHLALRAGYMETPRPRAMAEGRELFARRWDGSEFPVSVALSVFDSGEGPRVTAAIRDVSETYRTALALREALERAAESNRALQVTNKELESFSYSVSHDLRAPLRSVDGFSQILLGSYGEQLDAQGRDLLQRIRAGAQRMGQLIDDMLLLSRISRAELRRERIDLGALAEAAVAQLCDAYPERQVLVTIEPGLTAEADAHLVRILLDNLLGNAWKFTAKTAQAHISFGAEARDGQPGWCVRDNGAGFDMAYADKLFGAFQRLHSATDFPGSGIGLATVMRVVHKHGGQVRAEGEVDHGAAFWFSLQP